MSNVSQERFERLVTTISAHVAGKALDERLQRDLNGQFPAEGEVFESLAALCRAGIGAGWLCNREQGGIKFGRIMVAGPKTQGFSVDVVEMGDIVGPHHRHPTGEIDMIIPQTDGAVFDGHGKGWLVYEPGSAHSPTVSHGRAIVLYLLPEGAIEFSSPPS